MIQRKVLPFTLIATALTAASVINQPVTIAYVAPTDEELTEVSLLTTTNNLPKQLAQLTEEVDRLAEIVAAKTTERQETEPAAIVATTEHNTTVPFYSQFADISDPSWQKVGCGIASLAMLIDYYEAAVDVDSLLQEGISSGAYITSAGWSHAGLIALAEQHGLTGSTVGLAEYGMETAFEKLTAAVAEGPVMVSVHYTFEPTNPIPHLAVITTIENDRVYYNDPAETTGGGSITAEKFQSAWKKRYIEIRPVM